MWWPLSGVMSKRLLGERAASATGLLIDPGHRLIEQFMGQA